MCAGVLFLFAVLKLNLFQLNCVLCPLPERAQLSDKLETDLDEFLRFNFPLEVEEKTKLLNFAKRDTQVIHHVGRETLTLN